MDVDSARFGSVVSRDYSGRHNIDNKNEKQAFERFKFSAESGSYRAMYELAWCYSIGFGVKKNYKRSFFYFSKILKKVKFVPRKIFVSSALYVSYLYFRGIGVRKNLFKSLQLLKSCARLGDADAMSAVGFMYYRGLGTRRDIKLAVCWYRKAAVLGQVNALWNLGLCYYNGCGVKEDVARAFALWKKSARKGHLNSLVKLYYFFYSGDVVRKSIPNAVKFIKRASYLNDPLAQKILSFHYKNGIGVMRNKKLAAYWQERSHSVSVP